MLLKIILKIYLPVFPLILSWLGWKCIRLELIFSKGNGEACRWSGIGDLGETKVGGGVGNGVVGLSVVTASSVSSDLYDRSTPKKSTIIKFLRF